MAITGKQPMGTDQSQIDPKTTTMVLIDMRSAAGREFLAGTLEDARVTGRNLTAIRMAYRMSKTKRWALWMSCRGRAVPMFLGDGQLPVGIGRAITWWKAKIKPDSPVVDNVLAATSLESLSMAIEAVEEGISSSGLVLAKAAGQSR